MASLALSLAACSAGHGAVNVGAHSVHGAKCLSACDGESLLGGLVDRHYQGKPWFITKAPNGQSGYDGVQMVVSNHHYSCTPVIELVPVPSTKPTIDASYYQLVRITKVRVTPVPGLDIKWYDSQPGDLLPGDLPKAMGKALGRNFSLAAFETQVKSALASGNPRIKGICTKIM